MSAARALSKSLPSAEPLTGWTGLSGLEWTVNAYLLSFACLLLTGAALGDRFGRRRMCPLVTAACG